MTRITNYNLKTGEDYLVPAFVDDREKRINELLEQEKQIIIRAENNAAQILEQAKSDGEKLIEGMREQALSEVDGIKKQAFDEGFETGKKEGYADITNELTDRINNVNNFAKCNFDIKNSIIKSAYLDIIQLVIEIARKVCAKSLDEDVLKNITEKAIRSLKDKESINIIVNPEMAEKIYAISDELKERIPQLESIRIIEDNSVSPDGTIVESPMSRVDSRVQSQIDEIADKLMAKLNSTTDTELQSDD